MLYCQCATACVVYVFAVTFKFATDELAIFSHISHIVRLDIHVNRLLAGLVFVIVYPCHIRRANVRTTQLLVSWHPFIMVNNGTYIIKDFSFKSA